MQFKKWTAKLVTTGQREAVGMSPRDLYVYSKYWRWSVHNCFVVNQVLLIKALLSTDRLCGPSTHHLWHLGLLPSGPSLLFPATFTGSGNRRRSSLWPGWVRSKPHWCPGPVSPGLPFPPQSSAAVPVVRVSVPPHCQQGTCSSEAHIVFYSSAMFPDKEYLAIMSSAPLTHTWSLLLSNEGRKVANEENPASPSLCT